MSVAWMCDIRARSLPEMGNNLGDRKRQGGAEASGYDAVASVSRSPLAPGKKENGQQSDEEVLSVDGEEAKNIFYAVMTGREPVDCLIGGLVDTATLRAA